MTTIIDSIVMAIIPTTVVGADIVQLHIGFDPIKLGMGNGYEGNAINGQEGITHVSKVR